MWRFYKKRGKNIKKLCKYAKSSRRVHILFIFTCYYNNSSKEQYERRCNGVYLYHYTYNFFHNNRPGKPLPGHSSFYGKISGKLCFWGNGASVIKTEAFFVEEREFLKKMPEMALIAGLNSQKNMAQEKSACYNNYGK